jgi:excisionase family DNA binding protein
MAAEQRWAVSHEKESRMNRNLPRVAYRPREAAEVTGLSLRFLYYAIQHKDLPTIRVGRCRLITEKALREWLERKTEAALETRS